MPAGSPAGGWAVGAAARVDAASAAVIRNAGSQASAARPDAAAVRRKARRLGSVELPSAPYGSILMSLRARRVRVGARGGIPSDRVTQRGQRAAMGLRTPDAVVGAAGSGPPSA